MFFLGPAYLQPYANIFLPHLNHAVYPISFITAITTITAGTAILYDIPHMIAMELRPFLHAGHVNICCVLNYFLLTENQHIVILLPSNYTADLVVSPGLAVELETDSEQSV